MTDEPSPPVFPQYAPPVNPAGVAHLQDPKQQKPLMKLITKRLFPKRISKMQKKLGKRKKTEQGWT